MLPLMIAMCVRFFKIGLRLFLVCLFGLLTSGLQAQLNPERTAFNRLQLGKWESSLRLLQKSLRKDSVNVAATYVMSRWFLTSGNPDFHVDSAHYYIRKSEKLFYNLSLRDRERVQRFPIDSLILRDLHNRIDSTAFEYAKQINTEAAYNRFIISFPSAGQLSNAIELRDEVSFLEALKVNTYQSFNDYQLRYPQSHRVVEARKRYEKLLFEEKTKDEKLGSYKAFFQNYPTSPFSGITQQQIFELSTATGTPDSFHQYLTEYPQGLYSRLARDILFHLYLESDEVIPSSIESDSLKQVIELNSSFWIPFYKNGLFGFMNPEGREMIAPQFDEVKAAYKCGPVKDDILILESGLFSRSGKKLAEKGTVISNLGFGFLMAEHAGCNRVIHKSGKVIISECYLDYKIVGGKFIAAKKNESWILYTLTGRRLKLSDIQEVKEMEGVIVITRLGKKIVATNQRIAGLAEQQDIMSDLTFDEVLVFAPDLLLVRTGIEQGVINSKLQFTIPLDHHILTKTSFGLIETLPSGTVVRGLSTELENQVWSKVNLYRDWLVLHKDGALQLYTISSKKMLETNADSIWFAHNLAFVQSENRTKVHVSVNRSIDLPPDSKIKFINAQDSVRFFYTENKGKRKVFSLMTGDAQFTSEYEILESIGNDFFITVKGNKKGLLSRTGKELLAVEMDAMILSPSGQISLLKSKKFGLFDLNSLKLIKPVYERNVTMLDNQHLIVYKDGFYGIIGWNMKPVSEFEYLEIVPWKENVIWAKKNFHWALLNYITKEVIFDRIRDFSWIRKSSEESVARVHRENYYGLISSTKGLLIPPTFHEIINLGTPEMPFYFTEKGVEEADIYIVIYYNQDGKLVRRQAYEEDEYERIYCESD